MRNDKQEIIYTIQGMTCAGCAMKIERLLRKMPGVQEARVQYAAGKARIIYEESLISTDEIAEKIQSLGYEVVSQKCIDQKLQPVGQLAGALIVLLAVYNLLRWFGITDIFYMFPEAKAGMGYGMLFMIGLFTSIHCVAMCGGIHLSQCMQNGAEPGACAANRAASLKPSLLYNLGRILSYTLIGALIGLLGMGISFSSSTKGIIQVLAGVFMIVMGLNMLQLFPGLRLLQFRLPQGIGHKIYALKEGKGPFVIGLLNGFMPCGPLQAMQLYALSSGSPIKGALAMLFFGLGTMPLLFGLGLLSTVLSRKFTKKVMTAGAALVLIFGVSMLNSGLALAGVSYAATANAAQTDAQLEMANGVQIVRTSLQGGRYEPIAVQKDVPVKWVITVEKGDLNGCNYRMVIPEYDIEKQLEYGENIIEFTPDEAGNFAYSCWMGMIRSSITVVETGEPIPEPEQISVPYSGGMSCCGTYCGV